MSRVLRLGYVTFEDIRADGAARIHVSEIVDGLRRLGVEVKLYSPQYSSARVSVAEKVLRQVALQVQIALEAGSNDAFYFRGHPMGTGIEVLLSWLRIPVIEEVNGCVEDVVLAHAWARPARRLLEFATKVRFEAASAIVAVTPELRRWALEKGKNPEVFVIANGVNTEKFTSREYSDRVIEDEYVLFFGALARWQGIELMLNATRSREWPEGIKLVVAGDGAMKEMVETESAASSRVVYVRRWPHQRMPCLINGALATLSVQNNLGSRSDRGLSPLKVYESLACGKPVVVADHPGLRDIVRDNNCGWVVSGDDADELASVVRRLIKSVMS